MDQNRDGKFSRKGSARGMPLREERTGPLEWEIVRQDRARAGPLRGRVCLNSDEAGQVRARRPSMRVGLPAVVPGDLPWPHG